MAFYVLLVKESEDETRVIYGFGTHEDQLGRLLLDKTNGEVKELEAPESEVATALFPRAAVKLRQHWKSGHFPERTCWAS